MLSGCMQAATYEATNTANFKPRDKEMLSKTTYEKVAVAEPFRRAPSSTITAGSPRAPSWSISTITTSIT